MKSKEASFNIEAAIATGRKLAGEVHDYRVKAIKKRTTALKKVAKAKPKGIAAIPAMPTTNFMQMFEGIESRGVLVAEGDSWFDYPWKDVLSCLEDEHGYDVESVSHKGDRVEEIAYGGGQLEEFSRKIEKLIRDNKIPKAILLSGGGNDIAGDEFGMLLNHKSSPIAGLNGKVVDGVIERIATAYVHILSAITELCSRTVNRKIPILIHGYDYPVPDGRGFMGGWGPLPGPWLEPGFREKGFENIKERVKMATELIDKFNASLQAVTQHNAFSSHVKYVDLRGTLRNGLSVYKEDWANELHPSSDGFSFVSQRFAKEIEND